MNVLIIGLGTVGSNFIYALTKNKLRKYWNLTIVDYDIVEFKNLKSTPYQKSGFSKTSECLKLLLNNLNFNSQFISISDAYFGKIDDFLKSSHHNNYDVILDFQDNTNTILEYYPIECRHYCKCFINHMFGVSLHNEKHISNMVLTKYDDYPEMWFTQILCKILIEQIEENKMYSFMIQKDKILNSMNKLQEVVDGKKFIFKNETA